jgi:hypothetical protein
MKVAQHFSAGLAFLNASVPWGRLSFVAINRAIFGRPYRDGSVFSDINPALKCWATFIWSPPGSFQFGSRFPPRSIHDLENRLMTGSGGCRIQKIPHRGDRLPIASDDLPDIRSPHLYLEQDLRALFNLRYQHFVRRFNQVLYHEFEKVLHKTKFKLGQQQRVFCAPSGSYWQRSHSVGRLASPSNQRDPS